jgi:hypothetical protein
VDLFKAPLPNRRTIYGQIDRQNLPGVFRAFDFASPDTHSPQRFQTSVPQQALFLMNSPFLVKEAKALLERSEIAREESTKDKASELFKAVLRRSPSADELHAMTQYISQPPVNRPDVVIEPQLWAYGYGSYDAQLKTTKFTALPRFVGGRWQGGDTLPDAKLGFVMLSATGGHPGTNPNHAVIRRFIAPVAGTFRIKANVQHSNAEGDGVRFKVIQAGTQELVEKTVKQNTQNFNRTVELKAGETIDFIMDCISSPNSDTFSQTIQIDGPGVAAHSERQFAGPKANPKQEPINAWVQLAQALLLTNEYAFID